MFIALPEGSMFKVPTFQCIGLFRPEVNMGISVKAAAILSIIVEGILYGFATFLFAITLWALTYQRKAAEVARPMFVAACLLFIMSTMHITFNAHRLWQGFISLDAADTEQFFEDVSQDTYKDILNELETLLGDAILIYRCYVVWQRTSIIIIPVIGWMAVAVAATGTVWSLSQLTPINEKTVYEQETAKWVVSFYTTALVTNLIATSILALKLWLVHRCSSSMGITRTQAYPILRVIIESGALYSMTLVTMLTTYLSASNSAYVVTDMIGQIIPITFFLIIVRTTMLRFNDRTGQGFFTHTELARHLPTTFQVDSLTMAAPGVDKLYKAHSTRTDAV